MSSKLDEWLLRGEAAIITLPVCAYTILVTCNLVTNSMQAVNLSYVVHVTQANVCWM